jgi:hypothetical protein
MAQGLGSRGLQARCEGFLVGLHTIQRHNTKMKEQSWFSPPIAETYRGSGGRTGLRVGILAAARRPPEWERAKAQHKKMKEQSWTRPPIPESQRFACPAGTGCALVFRRQPTGGPNASKGITQK